MKIIPMMAAALFASAGAIRADVPKVFSVIQDHREAMRPSCTFRITYTGKGIVMWSLNEQQGQLFTVMVSTINDNLKNKTLHFMVDDWDGPKVNIKGSPNSLSSGTSAQYASDGRKLMNTIIHLSKNATRARLVADGVEIDLPVAGLAEAASEYESCRFTRRT